MNTLISSRVEAVRQWMREKGLTAFVVPTTDPHNSEYVPLHWQCREWLTGFTGSAGTAVVTADKACLWTDSRYWLQATEQLASTPFLLMREGEAETVEEWLQAEGHTHVITYDPRALPDPFDTWWGDRPALPLTEAWIVPDDVAGETAESKLARLVEVLRKEGRDTLLVEELSEVMWVLNLRGADIPFNPFLVSFLQVRATGAHTLYINKKQIPPSVASYLHSIHVDIAPYEEAPQHTEGAESPVAAWRCTKNEAEQEGFRRAHLMDGVAMVRFLRWLSETDVTTLTEVDIDTRLTALRAESPDYVSLSFATIAAYGPHGAIVHYEAEPATAARLAPHGLLLLDSGAHYRCGTTDITRTIALGPLTPEERHVYTLVLKAHLQLQHMLFPDGTTGLQLDTAARMPLWREGLDFGHGTGHGVGHCLGVHEGPHQIRKNVRGCTLLPFHAGQTMTIEPGVYLEGHFGVRIENVVLTQEASSLRQAASGHTPTLLQPFAQPMLAFEALTLCPYDLRAIDTKLLSREERTWLNDYHTRVYETLAPHLPTEDDRQWLAWATREV